MFMFFIFDKICNDVVTKIFNVKKGFFAVCADSADLSHQALSNFFLCFLFRIERMARDIHECFNDESLKVICILKGGYQFCNDLTHYLKVLNRGSGNQFIWFYLIIFTLFT